jgi:hypothetical protein
MLRRLTSLPGRPCVVANCHPTKGATEENLLPRGGGAFLAEVDGNLMLAKKDGALELHWQGKFRGPDFEPMAFELEKVTTDLLRDTQGRHVPTVIAKPLSETERTAKADEAIGEQHKLIRVMAGNPGASIRDLARMAGWTTRGSEPNRSKVQRWLAQLEKQRLVVKELGAWHLTPAGEKASKRVYQ